MLHPNGLCAGFFDPLAQRLTDSFRVVAVDLRGHGRSDAPSSREGLLLPLLAGDVLAVIDEYGFSEFSALGESLGGGVATMVDQARPGAMRRLVLCEGIVFDSSAFRRPASEDGLPGNAMAEMTRARRVVWPDRDVVRERYAARTPFDVVAPEALNAYIRWGFFDRSDGQVEMACAPETEAAIYEMPPLPSGPGAAFAHLPALAAQCSVLHGNGSYLPQPWFQAQADAAGVPLQTIPGGHFFLQEDTARGEVLVREALS